MALACQPSFCIKKTKLSVEETASRSGSRPLPTSPRMVPKVSVLAILFRFRVVLFVHQRVIAGIHAVNNEIFADVTKFPLVGSSHLARARRSIHHTGPSAGTFV